MDWGRSAQGSASQEAGGDPPGDSAARRPWWRRAWLAAAAVALSQVALSAQSLTVAWDPNPEPDVTGYVVSMRDAASGRVRRDDVGARTSWVAAPLPPGVTFCFTVEAYNASGLFSAPSAEACGAASGPASAPGCATCTSSRFSSLCCW